MQRDTGPKISDSRVKPSQWENDRWVSVFCVYVCVLPLREVTTKETKTYYLRIHAGTISSFYRQFLERTLTHYDLLIVPLRACLGEKLLFFIVLRSKRVYVFECCQTGSRTMCIGWELWYFNEDLTVWVTRYMSLNWRRFDSVITYIIVLIKKGEKNERFAATCGDASFRLRQHREAVHWTPPTIGSSMVRGLKLASLAAALEERKEHFSPAVKLRRNRGTIGGEGTSMYNIL